MNIRQHLYRGFHPDDNGKTTITLDGKKHTGEWVEGSLITGIFKRWIDGADIPYILCVDNVEYDCFEDLDEENGIYEVLLETVCEWTGLTDSKGRKIFEGDIVKPPCYFTHYYEIVYTSLVSRGIGYALIDNNGHILPTDEWDECEVIGTIFSNAELLGGAE